MPPPYTVEEKNRIRPVGIRRDGGWENDGVRRGGAMAKVVYEKRDRIGYVTLNRPEAIRSAKETILEVIGRPLDDALRLETVNGYSSVGDFREVAERLRKFFGKQ